MAARHLRPCYSEHSGPKLCWGIRHRQRKIPLFDVRFEHMDLTEKFDDKLDAVEMLAAIAAKRLPVDNIGVLHTNIVTGVGIVQFPNRRFHRSQGTPFS